ncbi:ANTAR domain-containing protein [Friedmanniella luteola]|uniref:ANTAR domain-containing protein n=1 Tax=Friedmanniella luteola TaxID=546871 RepID=A0A1H1XNB5_9ACTN|nr:GAF and ANTAR domain-containing protein [Friedmanniella luteola]SDT10757.1 ANTAR domain-containing protein [Friedmanniella luteola]
MTRTDGADAPTVDPGPQPAPLPWSGRAEQDGEAVDLEASVAALSRLAAGRLGLEELLREVATFAVHAIPGADGAGLTLLQDDRSDTVVTTTDLVRQVDEIQYSLGQGPCITAAQEGETVLSGSLGADPRWRRFGGSVARLGVHSALSLPLITPDGVVGAINVYALAKNAFDVRAATLGELFAVPAAIAVQNAQVLDRTRRLAAQLEHAVQNRGAIDRAVGIIISRAGVGPDEALARLRRLSQMEHRKLADVADSVVDEAAARARARARYNL